MNPISNELEANIVKSPSILNGVFQSKSESDPNLLTVLNKMILTISLNTPSPQTIENNLGYYLQSIIDIAAITSLEQRREQI